MALSSLCRIPCPPPPPPAAQAQPKRTQVREHPTGHLPRVPCCCQTGSEGKWGLARSPATIYLASRLERVGLTLS